MQYQFILQRAIKWLVVASFLSGGVAMAQPAPTVDQVYAAARAGKIGQAQAMIQQVLVSHPNSAKAYFVQSELFARQGNLDRSRGALAVADKLEPGLPFAKPQAVQALRAQLGGRSTPMRSGVAPARYGDSGNSWGLPALLAVGVMVLGYFMFRRRVPNPAQPAYGNPGGMNGPQTFGDGTGAMMQPSYRQAASSGLGGQIMGGLATGLAVGAGVMAAEAVGRDLFGNRSQSAMPLGNFGITGDQNMGGNADMGGQDFGLNDAGSWDDGGITDAAGGWDD